MQTINMDVADVSLLTTILDLSTARYNSLTKELTLSDDIAKKINEIMVDKNWQKKQQQNVLASAKINLKRQIDIDAEAERLKYITPGVGQSMTYQEKVNQAANYSKALAAHLKDPDNLKAPNENEYLLLKSSLGIDGETLAEVAENITWAYALWEQVGAAIETIRLQTKAAIDTATTVEEAQGIFDAVKWP
ncbi:hypothetical protein [Bartonella sp. HY038]|uniref:hypothetical protein n=1 Tax=Bartonella sp. HY038 TaxID=2759660 RepID=UPI0015FE592D|nr:hypothetical protein [Bartonella sp. HY038]